MKVLVACEESQEVCKAFRALGHEAYSCDIQEPSGGHPEWHILGDALKAIDGGQVTTMDGETHDVGKWDLLIAHPPCTYLTVTGNRWFNISRYGGKAVQRYKDREEAVEFLCSSSTATARELPLKILLAICQRHTKNQLKSFTHICLATRQEKQLAYG